MPGPIYKLFQARFTEAWYQISPEEQQQLSTQVNAALEKAGGRRVVFCASLWANEEWGGFGVEEFPDVEAVQKQTDLLDALHWYRYVESRTTLGTAVNESPAGDHTTAGRDAAGRPIYILWQARFREAWYQLSADAQQQLGAKLDAAREQAGGRRLVLCTTAWSDEEWGGFGVEVFPDVEAVQQHTQLLMDLNWFRYIESRSTLGTAADESP